MTPRVGAALMFVMGSSASPDLTQDAVVRRRRVTQQNTTCSLLFDPGAEPCPVRDRRTTPTYYCRPDFLILGTRKGGTTSLYTYITKHPAVFPAHLQGKASDGEVFPPIGSIKYKQAFDGAPADKLVGESHVVHLVHDASRIARRCGTQDARFIALLREPVDRCHSQFLMRARLGVDGVTIETNITRVLLAETVAFERWKSTLVDAFDHELPRHTPYTGNGDNVNALYEGLYHIHLSRFLDLFNATSLRIYWFDDFVAHTDAVLSDALKFIGADPTIIDLDAITRVEYNAHDEAQERRPNLELAPGLAARMRYDMVPFNEALAALLGTPLPPGWL